MYYIDNETVALFTRAWIEIPAHLSRAGSCVVALFTRAWIEIPSQYYTTQSIWSPSSRGRGLKLTVSRKLYSEYSRSPSSRGRGLKFFSPVNADCVLLSPSSRGRGLKCTIHRNLSVSSCVALFTRAWIEIRGGDYLSYLGEGRPLHEGVD